MPDPRDPVAVADEVERWVGRRMESLGGSGNPRFSGPLESPAAGMSTTIWFGTLTGLDRAHLDDQRWAEPVALRIFPSPSDSATATEEAALLEFVAARGFPAPTPLAVVDVGPDNPFAVPWTVLPRVPGRPMLDCITGAPHRARQLLRDLADLAVRLHAIDSTGAPLTTDGPLIDRWFDRYEPDLRAVGDGEGDRVLDRLHHHRHLVLAEIPVVCHGDLHPLNVVSARTDTVWSHAVIDWTDAMIGDRHFDVARTTAIFGVLDVAIDQAWLRPVARRLGPRLAQMFLTRYRSVVELDNRRLDYWGAAHLVRGWAQVRSLANADQPTQAAAAVPQALADTLLHRASRLLDRCT